MWNVRGEDSLQVGEHLIQFSGVPSAAPRVEQGVGIILDAEMQWRRADSFRLLRIKLVLKIALGECYFGLHTRFHYP